MISSGFILNFLNAVALHAKYQFEFQLFLSRGYVIGALKACKLLRQAQVYFASRKEQSYQIDESKTIEDREKHHEWYMSVFTPVNSLLHPCQA
jgi:hypothetical protein